MIKKHGYFERTVTNSNTVLPDVDFDREYTLTGTSFDGESEHAFWGEQRKFSWLYRFRKKAERCIHMGHGNAQNATKNQRNQHLLVFTSSYPPHLEPRFHHTGEEVPGHKTSNSFIYSKTDRQITHPKRVLRFSLNSWNNLGALCHCEYLHDDCNGSYCSRKKNDNLLAPKHISSRILAAPNCHLQQ